MALAWVKSSVNSFNVVAIFFLLCMVIVGCGGNYDAESDTRGYDDDAVGSISFSIIWEDNSGSHLVQPRFLCGNSMDQVTTVTAQIANGYHAIRPDEVWACSDGQGSISGVPVGSNYTLTVIGHNANGDTNYCAERIGITVNAGMNHIGEVTASRFEASVSEPLPEAIDLDPGSVTFRWEAAAGAAGYNLLISEFSDLSDPIRIELPSSGLSYSISTDGILLPATQYWWAVTPVSFDGASGHPYPDKINTYTTARDVPLPEDIYDVDYAHVMYRRYESGAQRYQLIAGISENGGPCDEVDVMNAVMKNALGNDLPPTSDGFYKDIYMWYDCSLENCSQAGPFDELGLWAQYGSLPADSYTLEIEMENGQTLAEIRNFPGQLVLPIVPSSSMTAQWSGGDIELSWSNPTTEANWDEVDQIRIVILDDLGNSVLYIRVPTTDESLTIPLALIAQAAILQGGSRLDIWQIQTRAYDSNGMNFARAYSNNTTLP